MKEPRNRGLVVSDPTANLEGGEFKALFRTFPPVSGEVPWDYFRGCVLMVHFRHSSGSSVEGSAAMVAPGVMLLANHVLAAHVEKLKDGREKLFFVAVNGSSAVDVWEAEGLVTVLESSDLALVTCRPRTAIPASGMHIAPMTDRWPSIGEPVMFAGFVSGQSSYPPSGIDIDLNGTMTASVGVVVEHYPEKRDSINLKFPCVEVGVFATGGVSGGPAFDKNGLLVGTFVYSMEVPDDENGPGYFVPVDQILDVQFEPIFMPRGFTSLRQLNNKWCLIVS